MGIINSSPPADGRTQITNRPKYKNHAWCCPYIYCSAIIFLKFLLLVFFCFLLFSFFFLLLLNAGFLGLLLELCHLLRLQPHHPLLTGEAWWEWQVTWSAATLLIIVRPPKRMTIKITVYGIKLNTFPLIFSNHSEDLKEEAEEKRHLKYSINLRQLYKSTYFMAVKEIRLSLICRPL